jgi:hypothetical protein
MVASTSIILRAAERLSHVEAGRLAELAGASEVRSVIIDMSRVLEATTPALTRLVVLHRELCQRGSELRLAAVRGHPAKLMRVHRLDAILPCINELPSERALQPSPLSRLFPAENAAIWGVAPIVNSAGHTRSFSSQPAKAPSLRDRSNG